MGRGGWLSHPQYFDFKAVLTAIYLLMARLTQAATILKTMVAQAPFAPKILNSLHGLRTSPGHDHLLGDSHFLENEIWA